MGHDKLVYMFIAFMAALGLLTLMTKGGYHKCYCNQKNNKLILLLTLFIYYVHYFLHCFGLYGFLFRSRVLLAFYLLIPVCIGLSWKLFETKHYRSACVLNNFTDIICDIPKDDGIIFTDVYRYLGIPDITIFGCRTNSAYIIITSIGYCIGLYKMFFI